MKHDVIITGILVGLLSAINSVNAADYEVSALFGGQSPTAVPGAVVQLRVLARTQQGDNLVGAGHVAFAIDLELSGSLNLSATAISNVDLNAVVFNNLVLSSAGLAQGNHYVGTSGITTDLIPPNPGSVVGDVVRLFDFDLTIPATAQIGQFLTITPSEGDRGNVAATMDFASVFPQEFVPATVFIVPEPAVLTPICLFWILLGRPRRDLRN
ncbi:MAG: hypothetical protein KF841_02210 [Phycisphaerae bacterium]|nr:hypothetical protein [Phycisphaerae bacterium]